MALEKITEVSGSCVYVPGDDIDTDRIIPARFMKCVTFDGLGEYLFYDVRHDEDGNLTDHALNDPVNAQASILLSGMNFGCGSSREHAPQSLYRAGFRAIIAGNFAEIFFGNSINLGIPCVTLGKQDRDKLTLLLDQSPGIRLKIDLVSSKIMVDQTQLPFDLRAGARDSLLNGKWDPLDELLGNSEAIDDIAKSLPYS